MGVIDGTAVVGLVVGLLMVGALVGFRLGRDVGCLEGDPVGIL